MNKDSILLFDLDGTLIDTDKANFLAYKEAVEKTRKLDLGVLYKSNNRFTNKNLFSIIPNLTDLEYENIIKIKKNSYEKYIHLTKVNFFTLKILKDYNKTNKIILATNSSKYRAESVLYYHGLLDIFDYKYFKEDYTNELNKFEYVLKKMKVNPSRLFVFENDTLEIKKAMLSGVTPDNTINIKI